MAVEKILVSACLLGEKTNYKGEDNYVPEIEALKKKYDILVFCPELEGGLGVPRLPSEIRGDRVVRKDGKDVTKKFEKGAEKALAACRYLGIKKAVLKEGSPSCGVHLIHNGLFDGRKIKGSGITARLLRKNGIEVYSEKEIDKLLT